MSNAYNHVTLIGNVCGEPEREVTQSGVSIAKFRIGVQRRFKDKTTGQRKADFVSVVAWRHTADFIAQYIHKGDLVVVDGEINTNSYEAQDGSKRYVTQVNADDVRRPYQAASTGSGPRGGGEAAGNASEDGDFEEVEDDGVPF